MIIDAQVDASGEVYACGITSKKDGDEELSDMLVFKMDSSLKLKWGKIWDGNETDIGISIAIHENQQYLYVCGNSKSVPISKDGVNDIFVFKLQTSDGKLIWARRIDTNTQDQVNDI
jgi:hypothetical protein